MNTPAPATDRELKILELLADGRSTQRQVADAVGVSLGLVNAVVRRLVKTGHLKVQNLNAKKVRYILTPKGLSEKTRRSFDYLRRTLRTYNACLERIGRVIADQAQGGRHHFVVVGEGDLAELVVVALQLQAATGIGFERRNSLSGLNPSDRVAVLNCGEPRAADIGISVLDEILSTSSSRDGGRA